MKYLLGGMIGVMLMSACNRGVEIEENSIGLIFSEQMVEALQTEFYRGNEKKNEVAETASDKSEPERGTKAKKVYESVMKIDSSILIFEKELNLIKLNMFKNKTILKELRKQQKNDFISNPRDLELAGKRMYFPSNQRENLAMLKKEIFRLRKDMTEITAKYKGSEDFPSYYFSDPNISSFKGYNTFNRQMNIAFEKSNVSQDDMEAIRKIYLAMTKIAIKEPISFKTPVDYYNFLLSIERQVFSARADCFSLIRLRVGCGGCYTFDKLITLVDCPSVCSPGDTIEVAALFAAYDSFKTPLGIINGEKFETAEAGVVKHKIVVPNKKEFTLKGSLTYFNKSGVPKIETFQKTIRILQPK